MPRIAAVTGFSGAGKTTLIASLIRHYTTSGERVAAIKHTHHPVNEDEKGDTAAFRAAGAEPVILAGDGEAVIFRAGSVRAVRYGAPPELLAFIESGVIFVEGFKSYDGWPRIELLENERLTAKEAIAILDRIWRS
jgi:molybdopterin-guanine dinucleotide biosynthesis protein B